MAVKVLIVEDNPVARSFLCRVVRESFSDQIAITEAGDLESARRQISLTGGAQGMHGVDPFKLLLVDLSNVGGVERIITFIAVGVMMLVVGYFAPLPPKAGAAAATAPPKKDAP